MFNRLLKNCLKCGVLPFSEFLTANKPDRPSILDPDQNSSDKTGLDRLKKVFEVDEFGNITEEANTVLQVAAMSLFVGAMYGGIINSRTAYLEFMQNNEATAFKSHLDAKRKLQDKVSIAFGKGAFKWGTRLTFFCSTFVGTATMIQTYRGKAGILEYVAAGGVSGFIYKFNMGPRGWIVGSGLGMVLGLICGTITNGLLKLSGLSLEEVRRYQNMVPMYRQELIRKGLAEHLADEDFAVIKLHDNEVGKAGEHIDNLDKDADNVKSKK